MAIDTVRKLWVIDVTDAALVITFTEDTVLGEPSDHFALISVGPVLVEALRVTTRARGIEGLHSCASKPSLCRQAKVLQELGEVPHAHL